MNNFPSSENSFICIWTILDYYFISELLFHRCHKNVNLRDEGLTINKFFIPDFL